MDPQDQKKCKKHSLEYIALSTIPQFDSDDRYMCPKCLSQLLKNNNITLIEDAQKSFDIAKSTFKNRKEDQIKTNIIILKDLEQNVLTLKNYYIKSIDGIFQSISNLIQMIERENNELTKLYQVTLDTFLFEKFDFKKWQFNFQESLNNLQLQFYDIDGANLLNKCLCTLQSFDTKQSEAEISNLQLFENNPPPLLCSIYKREAVFLEESGRNKRLACIQCIPERFRIRAQFYVLTLFKEKWIKLQDYKKQVYKIYYEQRKSKIEALEQNLELFQINSVSAIRGISRCLQQYQSQQKTLFNKINNQQQDFNDLTEKDILSIYQQDQLDEQGLLEDILNEFQQQELVIDQEFNQIMLDYNEKQEDFSEELFQFLTLKQDVDEILYDLAKIYEVILSSDPEDSESQSESQDNSQDPSNNSNENQKELMPQCSPSYALAFSQDSSVMVAGCQNQIIVFDFKDDTLQITQKLSQHSTDVVALCFRKKQKEFISGSYDGEIISWVLKNESWCCQQLLKNGHSSWIMQIIINHNENMIITCSNDQLIKCWNDTLNEWKCFQTLSIHTNSVTGISLNCQENLLVSCGLDKTIIISKFDENKQWQLNQKISVEQIGYRISFFGDDFIALQTLYSSNMDVYELNKVSLQCVRLLPMVSLSIQLIIIILINKNGSIIYFRRRNANGQFFVAKTIVFDTYFVFGALADDGKKFITWDAGIRRYLLHDLS